MQIELDRLRSVPPGTGRQLVLEGFQDLLGPPSLELGDDQLLDRLAEDLVPAGGDLVGGVRDALDVGPHGVGDGERPLAGADQDAARRTHARERGDGDRDVVDQTAQAVRVERTRVGPSRQRRRRGRLRSVPPRGRTRRHRPRPEGFRAGSAG